MNHEPILLMLLSIVVCCWCDWGRGKWVELEDFCTKNPENKTKERKGKKAI